MHTVCVAPSWKIRRNYKLGVGQEHRIYRNLSNTENIVLHSMDNKGAEQWSAPLMAVA